MSITMLAAIFAGSFLGNICAFLIGRALKWL